MTKPRPKSTRFTSAVVAAFAVAVLALSGCADDGASTRDTGSPSGSGSGSASGSGSGSASH